MLAAALGTGKAGRAEDLGIPVVGEDWLRACTDDGKISSKAEHYLYKPDGPAKGSSKKTAKKVSDDEDEEEDEKPKKKAAPKKKVAKKKKDSDEDEEDEEEEDEKPKKKKAAPKKKKAGTAPLSPVSLTFCRLTRCCVLVLTADSDEEDEEEDEKPKVRPAFQLVLTPVPISSFEFVLCCGVSRKAPNARPHLRAVAKVCSLV